MRTRLYSISDGEVPGYCGQSSDRKRFGFPRTILPSVLGTDFRGKGRDKVTSEKLLEHDIEVIQLRDKGGPRPGGWPRRGQNPEGWILDRF